MYMNKWKIDEPKMVSNDIISIRLKIESNSWFIPHLFFIYNGMKKFTNTYLWYCELNWIESKRSKRNDFISNISVMRSWYARKHVARTFIENKCLPRCEKGKGIVIFIQFASEKTEFQEWAYKSSKLNKITEESSVFQSCFEICERFLSLFAKLTNANKIRFFENVFFIFFGRSTTANIYN